MRCLTWNLEWAPPCSRRGGLIQEIIRQIDPDIICYTEMVLGILPDGYTVLADADYGYRHTGERRKVALWSRTPWTEVDTVGDAALPSGRYVSGVTQGIRFVGVCIPWKDAHVKTGRMDRAPWEDHLAYCEALEDILKRQATHQTPLCILGDYNQRIPRVSQPEHVEQALMKAFPSGFTVATSGLKDQEGKALIDHVACSPNLSVTVDQILPRIAQDGIRLSDHTGVVITL